MASFSLLKLTVKKTFIPTITLYEFCVIQTRPTEHVRKQIHSGIAADCNVFLAFWIITLVTTHFM